MLSVPIFFIDLHRWVEAYPNGTIDRRIRVLATDCYLPISARPSSKRCLTIICICRVLRLAVDDLGKLQSGPTVV